MSAVNIEHPFDDSKFIAHEPCPRCGSKDNLARYDDGHGYCFGCKYVEFPGGSRIVRKVPERSPSTLRQLPDDASPPIGAAGWTWLKKYGIIEKETEGFLWSDEKQWLIFPFRDNTMSLQAWQARNFNPVRPKPKYVNYGPMSDVTALCGDESDDVVVLVEDIISAIKIGRLAGVTGMPVFGSNIPLKMLTRLQNQFKVLGIWLDSDKRREALLAHSRASQYFPQVFTVLTDLDPKEYTDDEIELQILKHLED